MFLGSLFTLQQIQIYAIVLFFILLSARHHYYHHHYSNRSYILTDDGFKVTVCSIRCADCIIRGLFVRTIQKCRRWVATTPVERSVVLVEVPVVRTDRVLYGDVMNVITVDDNLEIKLCFIYIVLIDGKSNSDFAQTKYTRNAT